MNSATQAALLLSTNTVPKTPVTETSDGVVLLGMLIAVYILASITVFIEILTESYTVTPKRLTRAVLCGIFSPIVFVFWFYTNWDKD